MPDDKVILALMPSAEVAASLAEGLGAAFEERLAFLRTHDDASADAITPPLEAFAAKHGITWGADDTFSWDDDPLDPRFEIFAVGRLFVASHAAAYSIAEEGLQRLVRQHGATTVLLWSHDTDPLTLTLHFTSDLGVQWFKQQWERIFYAWGAELPMLEGAPPDEHTIVHFTGPGLSWFVEATSSSVVTAALRGVSQRPGVEATLHMR